MLKRLLANSGLILLSLVLGLACSSDLKQPNSTPSPTATQPDPTQTPVNTRTPSSPAATADWRNIGSLDNQIRACIAPTVEEFYAERQMEFGGSGGKFSEGSLETVLNSLPFGECSEENSEFPIFEITQCDGAIAFFSSGGFTLENEFFSTETGKLVYASVDTDCNAFCNNVRFGVEYGEKPLNRCQTQKVSYCGVDREEVLNLYRSNRFSEIGPTILAAQE